MSLATPAGHRQNTSSGRRIDMVVVPSLTKSISSSNSMLIEDISRVYLAIFRSRLAPFSRQGFCS